MCKLVVSTIIYPNKNPALPSQAFPPFHHIPSIHWGYNRCSGTGGEDRLSRSWLEAIANDTRCPHLTERNDTKATPLQLTTIYFTSLFWHVVISSLIKFCLIGFLPFFQVWPGVASKHTFPVEARKKKIQIIMQLVPSRGSSASVETLDADTPFKASKEGDNVRCCICAVSFFGLNGIAGKLKTRHWWREFEIAWCERLMLQTVV